MNKYEESPEQARENAALKNYSPIKPRQAAVAPSVEEEKPEEVVSESELDEVEETEEGDLTKAELKEALDAAGIEYSSHALKAELRQLYDDNGLGD